MAYAYALDPTEPANTDLVQDGAADMRLIKNALIERIESFFQDVDNDPLQVKSGVTFLGSFTQSAGTAALQATTVTTITTTSHASIGAAANLRWTGSTIMTAPADGRLLVTDSAGTAFTRMMFGGTTSSYPAITRSTTALHFKLADDSAFAPIQALTINGTTITASVALVGTLSTAAQPNVTSVGTTGGLTVAGASGITTTVGIFTHTDDVNTITATPQHAAFSGSAIRIVASRAASTSYNMIHATANGVNQFTVLGNGRTIITNSDRALQFNATANGTYGSTSYMQWFRADAATLRGYLGFGANNDPTLTIGTQDVAGVVRLASGNDTTAITIASNQVVTPAAGPIGEDCYIAPRRVDCKVAPAAHCKGRVVGGVISKPHLLCR